MKTQNLVYEIETMALEGFTDQDIADTLGVSLDLVTVAVARMDLRNFEKDMEADQWALASAP